MIQYGAEYIVSAALIMTALIMMVREGRRRYWRSGRLTAAALLLSVAVLLLLDKFTGLDDMLLLRKWWPLLFVFWGLEHILALVWNFRKSSVRSACCGWMPKGCCSPCLFLFPCLP
ncbi:hypothetical protein HMSSN036_88800 [Paenibacillus macerans]|nr:hypothetical protein HMSSN036_88800 [Paenibacillus macerans]